MTYPEFDDIPVNTKTIIAMTNLCLDIKKLFEFLPITEYVVIPKKRGRKKKVVQEDPNKHIKDGDIITLDLANEVRGVSLKKKKKKDGENIKYFRNSLTVVMCIDGKKINFKISRNKITRNGKFQITGCKYDGQAEKCVKWIWDYIKDNKDIYSLSEGTELKALFIPAMRNIHFNLGFVLDREKLDEYFNNNTDYHSLLETSIGYTGVNIKIPVKKPITDLLLKELTHEAKDWGKAKMIPYSSYLNTLKPKDQQKKLDKVRYTTFLVFHSGQTICSAMCEDVARDSYYEFIEIIKNNRKEFEVTF